MLLPLSQSGNNEPGCLVLCLSETEIRPETLLGHSLTQVIFSTECMAQRTEENGGGGGGGRTPVVDAESAPLLFLQFLL